IAFSPDGQTILSGSQDHTARRWQLNSGRLSPKGPALQHTAPVHCVAFSPDGTKIASAGGAPQQAGELKIWNSLDGHELAQFQPHEPVLSLAFSPDGKRLAVTDTTSPVDIWDVETATVMRTIPTGLNQVQAVAYSPAGDAWVMGDDQGGVELWNENTGSRRLGQHSGQITDLAFSIDGQRIASSASDSLIILWDVRRGDKADVLYGHSKPVRSLSFSPNGKSLVSVGEDNTFKTWDLAQGRLTENLAAHNDAVGAVTFSPVDDHLMASASEDGSVKLWNVETGKVIDTPAPYGGPVRCVAFSPDGKTLAYAGGEYGQPADVVLWDREHRTFRRTAKVHPRAVLALEFSPDGATLASGGDKGLLALWDVNSATLQSEPRNLSQAVVSLSFSPDGKLLATSSFHLNEITLWNLDNLAERKVLRGHRDWVTAVAFSPDGNTLASGSVDRTVRLWDIATETEKLQLAGHSQSVGALAFSPDGVTLASIGRDDQLRLWDVATGQEKLKLDCQLEMDGVAVAFSRHGRTLAAGNNRFIRVHRAAKDQDLFLYQAAETPTGQPSPPNKSVRAHSLTLQASPFSHRHPNISHRASHWQVRRGDAGYTVPTIDHLSTHDLNTLRLRPGVLSPNTEYFWRVAYTGSNQSTTALSTETRLFTDDFFMKAVPFDLTSYFNCDIVKNPGDEHTDSIDTSFGSHLVVEQFDGQRTDNPDVDGLPRDGKLGLHVLGDYSQNNAIQTGIDDKNGAPIRISSTPGNYHFVRFLVVGGNGNSDMPVRFDYADGSVKRAIVRCDDWFHDLAENRYGKLRTGLLPVINEMDRFFNNQFRDDNAAAVFEVIVEVDPAKELLAIELEVDSEDAQYTDTALQPNHARTRFNLLAITGIRLDP
ncbi:MAG: WD40 repeat domain-containing protein, partial [Pirellulales bacterium]|nr:WD40 repeat domain-containing protein [Pirellulales bacterium]